MALGRNAKRRLALYAGGAAVALLILLVPRAAERGPDVTVRKYDIPRAHEHEATKLLVDLVRTDTSDPPGITRPAVEILARAFACEGIPYEIVGDDSSRPLIVARISGLSRRGSLLLLNHLDVVPPGDLKLWNVPPFAGETGKRKDESYIYGRGTLDMKGQAAASFWAMARLVRDGIVPLHDVVFLGETGEETYRPEIGIGWVMAHRPDLLEGVTDVFNEGGVNETLGDSIQRFGIEVMQKAAVNVFVGARTKEELEAFKGFCEKRNDGEPYRTSPQVLDYLRFIGPSRSDVWGRPMIDPEKAIASENFRRWAPDVYQTLVRDRLYCGVPKRLPDGRWEMEVAWSLLPGSVVVEKEAEMQGWLRARGLTSRPHLVTADCVAAPESGRGWEVLQRVLAMDPVEKGASVGVWVLTGSYTNSTWCRAHGLRAYGVSPFNVTIFDAARIHGANERIHLGSFVEGVERMARIVREYATAP